jgi:hypothetical protein
MGRICDEGLLRVHELIQARHHVVEALGERLDLGRPDVRRGAGRKIPLGDRVRRFLEARERLRHRLRQPQPDKHGRYQDDTGDGGKQQPVALDPPIELRRRIRDADDTVHLSSGCHGHGHEQEVGPEGIRVASAHNRLASESGGHFRPRGEVAPAR